MAHRQQHPSTAPGIWSHVFALGMPFTVVVLVPWWLIAADGSSAGPIWQRGLGALLFCGSLGLFAATVRLFIGIGKGTLAPWDPTRHLVIVGPYRYTRNPMISGVLGMILGEALWFGSAALLGWAAIFFFVNTFYFVAVEEPTLREKFDQEYVSYCRRVPRWLPRLRP